MSSDGTMRALGALVIATLAAACGGPAPGAPIAPACEGAAGACVELVAGADASIARDGDEIELVYGPQGGWHVEVGARLEGVDPAGTVVVYEARREADGAPLCAMRYAVNVRRLEADGTARVRSGDLAIFDITSEAEVVDRDVTFEVRLEGEGGQVIATDVRTLRVVDRIE